MRSLALAPPRGYYLTTLTSCRLTVRSGSELTETLGDCVDESEAVGAARERLNNEDRRLERRQGAMHDQVLQLRRRLALLRDVGLRENRSPHEQTIRSWLWQ